MNDLDPSARLRAASSPSPAPTLDASVVEGAADRRAPRLVNRGRVARGAGLALGSVAVVSAVAVGVNVAFPAAPSGPLFAAAASGSGAEAAAMAADARMMIWVDYDYVAGQGLDAAAGRGSVYQLRLAGTPEALARDAADAFGLDGAPREAEYSAPEYPTWVVGPEDGSAPSLSVSSSGTGSWWYSDPDAVQAPVCAPAEAPADASGGLYDVCELTPPADSLAPSDEEARARASALFAETGLDVDPADVRIVADPYQTTASASLSVDGEATALEWSVTWSSLGEIAWASGHGIEVIDRGAFDTVSATDAVARLEDGRWFGAPGPDYAGGAVMYAADSLARDAVTAEGSGTDGTVGTAPEAETPSSTPAEPAPAEPVPSEPTLEPAPEPDVEPLPEVLPEPLPVPEPEVVTVTLERAEPTLLLMWDVDGNAWLVPGYAYEHPEQDFWTAVVSLVEGVITLPEPLEIEAF